MGKQSFDRKSRGTYSYDWSATVVQHFSIVWQLQCTVLLDCGHVRTADFAVDYEMGSEKLSLDYQVKCGLTKY